MGTKSSPLLAVTTVGDILKIKKNALFFNTFEMDKCNVVNSVFTGINPMVAL
jgi:hypothetical protein